MQNPVGEDVRALRSPRSLVTCISTFSFRVPWKPCIFHPALRSPGGARGAGAWPSLARANIGDDGVIANHHTF